MTDYAYAAQRAKTRAADTKHAEMKQWYAVKLNCNLDKVKDAILHLPSERAKQLYQEWLNESSA